MRELFLYIIIFIMSFGCSSFEEINLKIYKSQKDHLKISPYDPDGNWKIKIKKQAELREKLNSKYFNNLEHLSDTIFIVEAFDPKCINCTSDNIKVLIGDNIFTFDLRNGVQNLTIDTTNFQSPILDKEYLLNFSIMNDIRKMNINSLRNDSLLLELGAKSCFGGTDTIVSVVFPDKNVESIYVRCWGL